MTNAEDLSRLLLPLNSGLLSDRPWQAFLAAMAKRMDAFATSMMLRCPAMDERGLMYNYGGIPDVEAHYAGYYWAYDPFVNLPDGQLFTLSEFMRESDRDLSTVYMRFLEQIDMVHIIGVDLREPGKYDTRFRVIRRKAQGDFSADDKELCRQLVPHLRTAIRLATELDRVRLDRAVYAEAMDQLTMATVILDETGKIVHTNKLADLVLAQRDGLSIWNRELVLSNNADHSEFKQMFARSLRLSKSGKPAFPEILRIRRPSGRHDFGMIVRPAAPNLPGQKRPMTSSVVVFLSVDHEQRAVPVDVVQKLFGLTRAEAELTWRLAVGQTLAEASTELDISQNTARSHLRAIFAKTGFERQTQLIRGVLRSVAMLGHVDECEGLPRLRSQAGNS